VENTFGMLKYTFRGLLTKPNLDVVFLPNVILCCAVLHNILLDHSHNEVERLFQQLRIEGLLVEVLEVNAGGHDVPDPISKNAAAVVVVEKRAQISVHLTKL